MTITEIELIKEMHRTHNHRCFVCGSQAVQRAHIIGNTVMHKRIYGKEIIDNQLNWLPACSLKCNALIDIGKASLLSDAIAESIRHEDRQAIEDMVRNNIERKKAK